MAIDKTSFSIVIPCYNSTGSLSELVARICRLFSQTSHEIEIILVNDGSVDSTWDLIQSLGSQYPQLVGINLSRNFGQQSAVLCGFEKARYEYLVTLDDDLQHSPEDILLLYQFLIGEDLDLVIARLDTKQHGFIRNLGTKFVQYLSSHILTVPKDFRFSSFRVMKKFVAKNSLEFKGINPVIGFLLIKNTNKIANYRVTHEERKFGTSNYNFFELINYCLIMILDYSSLPFKLMVYLGSLIVFLGFSLCSFYLINFWLHATHAPGFIALVLLICFFFCFLFISIGLINSFRIRLLQSINSKPLYLVKETINLHNDIF